MSTPAAKLVLRIRDALAVEGRNAPVESLAADFAKLCHEAGQRLDSCAAMLEKGSDYQALQLAEAEPALLDLLATLSFAEAREWAGFCLRQGLATAVRFDPKAVQLLDALYAQGISPNHPLYKDYRAAITSHDDVRAIQAIRSIARLNPHDENARSELARFENKLYQAGVKELRAALHGHDEAKVCSVLTELERLATPAKLSESPDYAAALPIRREAEKREAMELAMRLVDSLDEEREAGAWRMIGDLLARIAALQAEHGFDLSPDHAVVVAETQAEFDSERRAVDEASRFAAGLAAIGTACERVETRLLTPSTLTLSETRNLYADLNGRWKELEHFPKPVPEELGQRVKAKVADLRAEVDRLQRQQRVKVVASCLVVLAACAVAAWFVIGAVRMQESASRLAEMRNGGQVEAAEKLIARLRADGSGLTGQSRLAARVAEVDHWARDERAMLARAESKIAELEASAATGFTSTDPMSLHNSAVEAGELVQSLAGGLRTTPAARLTAVRNRVDERFAALQENLVADAERSLTAIETLSSAKLGYDQPRETIAEALTEIDPPLHILETRAQTSVPALALPAAQVARLEVVRKRCQLFREELEALQKVSETMVLATSLDAYRQALNGYKTSRLSQVREVNEARKLLAGFPTVDALLASLLVAGDAAAWPALRDDAAGGRFVPENVQPGEMAKLFALRDDPNLNDVMEATVIDYRRGKEKREVYVRGEVQKSGPSESSAGQTTQWSAAIYEPTTKSDVVSFVPTTLVSTRSSYGTAGSGEITETRRSAVSELLSRLELSRVTDATGEKFERSVLRLFDEVVREKSANVVAKACVMQQLAGLLNLRPEHWGLAHCASLGRDLAELQRLCGGATLRSDDWLSERRRALLSPKLAPFFTSLQNRSYLAEARLHREIVRAVVQAGLLYGGYLDGNGQMHLLGEARRAKSLWTFPADGAGLLRFVLAPDGGAMTPAASAPLSPILFVPLDPDALVADAVRRVAEDSAVKLKRPAIPWLEVP